MKYPKYQSSIIRLCIVISIFYLNHFKSNAQTTFWSENFNNGCAANCLASTWNGWTIIDNADGTNGAEPNNWFISCAEEGIAPPGCGSSCIGDASLHIGVNPGAGGDMAASFNETGAANATYKLVVSPTISTVGKTDITLSFDFIAFGSPACSDDRAQLRLSVDNGATWPAGYHYCLTSVCCGACNGYSQGQWTTYTLSLPVAFNNNPNVKIGFHWRNNGNGSGTDPSVAIDDIRLSNTVLPIILTDFTAKKVDNDIKLNWIINKEINFSHYDVERSNDGIHFTQIGQVPSKKTPNSGLKMYDFIDFYIEKGLLYYRLKMVDLDKQYTYSKIISIQNDNLLEKLVSLDHFIFRDAILQYSISSSENLTYTINMYNTEGKIVLSKKNEKTDSGTNIKSIDTSGLPAGAYFLQLTANNTTTGTSTKVTEKVIKTR